MQIPGVKSRPEAEDQVAFFNHLITLYPMYPWLVVAYASPNGGLRPSRTVIRRGKKVRYSVEGQKLRAQGAKDGVPDVCIPAPRGDYHGLYFEFKRRPYRDKAGKLCKEYPSPEQRAFLRWLTALGHYTKVTYGVGEAIDRPQW